MATTEERMKILKMIEEGKITPEEGAKLLAVLSRSSRRSPTARATTGGDSRWLRVRVTDLETGRPKVNVNLPMGLVNVGLQIGAHFVPEVEGFDMEQLADAIRAGVSGKIVDVIDEEDGERVEVFVE